MRLTNGMRKALLALTLVGVCAGTTFLSGGMCGGGGEHYESQPSLAAK